MALIADDATDRVAQIHLLTERLAAIVETETAALAAGKPASAEGASAIELQRLANAYRLEMARIKDDQSLVSGAPRAEREKLQAATAALQVRLDSYAIALGAAREVTEGLVRAMAEEVQRARHGPAGYGAQGGYVDPAGAAAVALDQRA
ncbi:MAG: flagellar basal body protein [Alphaproteobacteria bacterium]|nr:flagellar basal body protein [Alphaproteobacteria bacterium]